MSDDRLAAAQASLRAQVARERALNVSIGLVVAVFLVVTYRQTEFSPEALVKGANNMLRILSGFLHPDVSVLTDTTYFREGLILHFMLQTLSMAFLGTLIGTVVAMPISFLAARNLMRRNPAGTAIYFLVRSVMSVVRAVPTLFWGLLFVTAVGLGPMTGVLAVSLFSFGLVSKLFSEAIEAIDPGQVEAMVATGANSFQVVVHGVVPQVVPYLVAQLLYTFEVNVHSATILGVVGAGGIGFIFIQQIEQFQYAKEAMTLIVIIAATMLVDYSSAAIRRRLV